MSKHKEELLKALEAQARAKRENKLRSFKPYPKQLEFIGATKDHSEVVLQAGNQVGKSEAGAYMTAVHLTGLYPDWWPGRRFDGPTRGWAAGESAVAVRDIQQRKLLGPPGDEAQWGTGMIPKSLLAGKILGHGAGGAIDTVKVQHASGGISELSFKSYEQGREKFQGATLDFIWWDEEPSLDLYLEGLARTIATDGLNFATFTPLNGLNQVLPRFQERSAEAMRNRMVVRMRMTDAVHLADPERQKALLATFPDHQKRARIDGLPMLGSGAVFDFDVADVIDPIYLREGQVFHRDIGALDTRGWAWMWALDFGISHPFGAVLLGWDRDRDIIYVVAEVRMKNATISQHAQRLKAIAINCPVAWPHDGHARDRSSGLELAKLYKNDGLHMRASHATFATGGYSTEAGVQELIGRFQSGRLRIGAGLHELLDEVANYHRKDGLLVKEGDDLLSALRIGVVDIRHAQATIIGANPIARKPGVRMARDLDGDWLFD